MSETDRGKPNTEKRDSGFLSGVRAAISFLTILPVYGGTLSLTTTSEYMYIFPVVGCTVGLIAGFSGWLLLHVLPPILSATVTFGVLLILSGLHDFDGLMDLGDGLMCKGSAERKIQAMRDTTTGVGGVAFGVIAILLSSLTISYFAPGQIIFALGAAELNAKFSMTLLARINKSAAPGSNVYFITAMSGERGVLRIFLSSLITLVLAYVLEGGRGIITFVFAIVAVLIVSILARRHFKGVTGDVFGGANELTRLVSLLVLVVLRTSYF